MTEPLDFSGPRSAILGFTGTVNFLRPSVKVGSLEVPAGVTMVQILWNGDARLIVFADDGVGSLVGAWSSNMLAPPDGEYPYFHIVSSVPARLAIQGYTISQADLGREMAVNFIPITAE